ncbi:hypothetical protein ACFE04_020389 [Oxalis oulophora]
MPAQNRPLHHHHHHHRVDVDVEDFNNNKDSLLLQQNHMDGDDDSNNNNNNNNSIINNDDDDYDEQQKHQQQQEEQLQGEDESDDRDDDSYGDDDNEYITVRLADIRKEVQCPICLGIIRKTRTVMECLHRFCRECIDKSMRMGNNECPACRTHCASRRSLRDDPNYDAIIAILYPDIDKYEEEELALQEEEKACTKQIQASIAQTIKRQTDAACRKRSTKGTKKTYNRHQDTPIRSKRNFRSENQGSEEKDDDDEEETYNLAAHGYTYPSSADERSPEVRTKRGRRLGDRFAQPSSGVTCFNQGGEENESEATRDSTMGGLPAVFASDRFSWGKGGLRSRHGSANGGNCKNKRHSRKMKLIDQIKRFENNKPEMSIMFVSLNIELPKLKEPYICCSPTLSVQQLCQYVSFQTGVNKDELELYLVTELCSEVDVVANKDKLRILKEQESIEGLNMHICYKGHTVLGYQKKLQV